MPGGWVRNTCTYPVWENIYKRLLTNIVKETHIQVEEQLASKDDHNELSDWLVNHMITTEPITD